MRGHLLTGMSFSLLLVLAGCAVVTSHGGEPSGETASGGGIYAGMISDHQAEIVQKAQAFIQSRHPGPDPAFPNIRIRHVTVDGVPSDDSEIAGILRSLSSNILGTRPDVATWDLDVAVTFQYHQPNHTAAMIMAVPEGVVCLSTVFLICPAHSTEEVVMEVQVIGPGVSQPRFASAGYGEIYESTLMLGDNQGDSTKRAIEQNTEGLVAAIVGAADKLVYTYKGAPKSP